MQAARLFLKVALVASVEVALQTVFSVAALIFLVACGCPALYLGATNTTLLENQFPMKEYVQIRTDVFCPLGVGFYRLRWTENLRIILGPRWWLRLILPIHGGPIDLGPVVSPIPSIEGKNVLRMRME